MNIGITSDLITRGASGYNVRSVVLPASAGLWHDIIDPTSGIHPEATVYPILFDRLDLSKPPLC